MWFWKKYYEIKRYIDIAYDEIIWFTELFLQLMGILFVLERVGVVVRGNIIYVIVIVSLVFLYCLGRYMKKKRIYDTGEKVEANINPVMKDIWDAAKIIINNNKKGVQ